jgi:hypothetical protein
MKIFGFNALDKFAQFRMSRYDGVRFPWTLLKGGLCQIQPQPGFSHLGVRSMASETVAGEDRLYIFIEIQMLHGLRCDGTRMRIRTSNASGQQRAGHNQA